MRLVGGSDHCPIYVTLKHQPPPPPHSPPLLSSKRRSKQAKLLSFFDSGGSKTAKRPRLHEAGTGDREGEAKALGGGGDAAGEEEASRAGSVREEPERETAEASELLPAGTASGRPPSPCEEEEEVFKSATQEAVEGATHLIMEAIKSRSGTTGTHQRTPPFPSTTTTSTSTSLPSSTATTSTTTTAPTAASKSASPPTPPVAKATATAKPAKAKTKAKTTNGQTSKGSGQTSMLAFLGKRKDRDEAGGSG
jgi:hypothetical protein